MYFYVQQIDIDKNSKRHDVILDVASMDDHEKLSIFLNGQSPLDTLIPGSNASMLRLSYIPSGQQGLKEGSWYDIDIAAFVGTKYQITGPRAAGASFLRANLIGTPNSTTYAKFLTQPQTANISPSNLELVVDPSPKGEIELMVVNCGHGNWNEIRTTADRIIYDVGASRWFTKVDVRTLVAKQRIASEARSVSVVISHWDIDHYHALLEFNSAELAKLRVVFTPSQVPNTETFRRVHKLLNDHGVVLAAQPPASRTGTSREIVLKPLWTKGIFTMFRATPGRSRNQTGIVLGVRGKSEMALLTGDHHYDKVLAAVGKVAAADKQPCVLVVPHHGGLAGSLSAVNWLQVFSSVTTTISCGPNSYGHPFAAVEAELKTMQAGADPWHTDRDGTWIKSL